MQYKCDGQTDGQTNKFRTTVKYRAIASRGKSIRNEIIAFEFKNLACGHRGGQSFLGIITLTPPLQWAIALSILLVIP